MRIVSNVTTNLILFVNNVTMEVAVFASNVTRNGRTFVRNVTKSSTDRTEQYLQQPYRIFDKSQV